MKRMNTLTFFSVIIATSTIHISQCLSPAATAGRSNRLFLDTAMESEWASLIPLGIFHGITTNPALLEVAGHECTIPSVQSLAKKALSIPNCDEFMCQSWGQSCDEMYHIGMALSEIDRQRIVVKVPVTFEGTKAASKLIHSGVRVCLTACYSSDQAVVAAGLGADYIAPYLGRMIDGRKDGMEECRQMQRIVNGIGNQSSSQKNTKILVASIRDVKSMSDLMVTGGMDTFTFNPDVARQLFNEQLTAQAAAEFESAVSRCNTNNKKIVEKEKEQTQVQVIKEIVEVEVPVPVIDNSQNELISNLQLEVKRLNDAVDSNQRIISTLKQKNNERNAAVSRRQDKSTFTWK